MKRTLLLSLAVALGLNVWAQTKDVRIYYSGAREHKGAQLKTALYKIINAHTMRKYNDLWEDFRTTDRRSDGTVRDIYSDTHYTFGKPYQGNNSTGTEGAGYNREHSFPKSWFCANDKDPMYTDLHHLYPADVHVNSKRNDYPYGETDAPTFTSTNQCEFGPSNREECLIDVFEPCDSLKGDLARTYFYMVTAYENRIHKWQSTAEVRSTLDGTAYPAFTQWQLETLLRWAKQDPVSSFERHRNDAVYGIQGNRNPFIDYPGLEAYIWGDKQADDPQLLQYVNPYTHAQSEAIAISASELHAKVDASPLPIDRIQDVAQGQVKANVYARVQRLSDLAVGRRCLIIAPQQGKMAGDYVMTALKTTTASSYFLSETVDIDGDTIYDGSQYTSVLLGKEGDYYTLQLVGTSNFLSYTPKKKKSDNNLYATPDKTSKDAQWKISVAEDGTTSIANVGTYTHGILFNSSGKTPRFSTYTSNMKSVQLFVEATDPVTGIYTVLRPAEEVSTTYDLSGRRTSSTAKGIVIQGGKKRFQ